MPRLDGLDNLDNTETGGGGPTTPILIVGPITASLLSCRPDTPPDFDLQMVAGDTAPTLVVQFFDGNGSVLDLTNSTVQLHVGFPGMTAIVNQPMTLITVPTGNAMEYAWQTGDTVAGIWRMDFVITFQDGTKLTAPDDGYLSVNFEAALA